MVKSVEEAEFATSNALLVASVSAPQTESFAYGDEVPMPSKPVSGVLPMVISVVVAGRLAKRKLPMFNMLLDDTAGNLML